MHMSSSERKQPLWTLRNVSTQISLHRLIRADTFNRRGIEVYDRVMIPETENAQEMKSVSPG